MKHWKTLKRIGFVLLLVYTHWLSYDHGRSFPDHMKQVKNAVEQTASFTAGMLRR